MTFYRRNLPHLQRDAKPHFISFVTYHRWQMPGWARSIVLACCVHDHESRYQLHAAVVMPDHVHLILTPLISKERAAVITLAEIMSGIKGTSSHQINRRLERRGKVWQEESFDRVLRSSEKLDEKTGYILNNPVRKGLVTKPEDYPWLWPVPGHFAR
ncbi:MAG: REP-associated tyrosine transposase [Terriglobales bacterium]